MINGPSLPCSLPMRALSTKGPKLSHASGVARAAQGSPSPARVLQVSRLEAHFLPVWFACVAADWLQGPYLFALYKDRGCSKRVISRLFAVGFVSSGALGSFVGGLCDRMGRRRGCLLYCVLSFVSCLLTHSTTVAPLAMGRLLGGVAESLLYSAFEVWATSEHRRTAAYSTGAPLSRLLSRMWLGSWLVAILAGLAASTAVRASPSTRWHYDGWECLAFGGPTASFDLAACCSFVGCVLILLLWRDHGLSANLRANPILPNARASASDGPQGCRPGTWRAAPFDLKALHRQCLGRLRTAAQADPRIVWCGAVIAAFEGSMFVFVFSWSPVLVAGQPDLVFNLGLVFSAFMLCCACGSSAFEALCVYWTPSELLAPLLASASLALAGAAVAASIGAAGVPAALVSFLAFELCIGVYFPCVSAVKSQCVPESMRSFTYSLYRVPLNALALTVLLGVPSSSLALGICAAMLSAAAVLAARFRM